MAKHRVRKQSFNFDNKLVVVLAISVVAGFLGGFVFAKDRYMDKITQISRMNMEKAVTIDTLTNKLQVLGASTEAEE